MEQEEEEEEEEDDDDANAEMNPAPAVAVDDDARRRLDALFAILQGCKGSTRAAFGLH